MEENTKRGTEIKGIFFRANARRRGFQTNRMQIQSNSS
jgi:hypothetical protein